METRDKNRKKNTDKKKNTENPFKIWEEQKHGGPPKAPERWEMD